MIDIIILQKIVYFCLGFLVASIIYNHNNQSSGKGK